MSALPLVEENACESSSQPSVHGPCVEPSAVAPDLLVVSDLHLGHPQHPERDVLLSRWLHALIRKHTDRPLRMVLNGDIFELLVRPGAKETRGEESARVNEALREFDEVCDHIPLALAAMGTFVAAGHELHFVPGNHDRELVLPQVAERLVDNIASVAPETESLERLRERIQVHSWFYWEKDVFYAEHGNQYDKHASYPEWIFPDFKLPPREIEEPYTHVAARFFSDRVADVFDLEQADSWTFWDFIGWLREQAPQAMASWIGLYVHAICALFFRAFERRRWRPMDEEKAARALGGVAERHGVSIDALQRLRKLWVRPASLFPSLNCLMADRLFFGTLLLMFVALAPALWLGPDWWWVWLVAVSSNAGAMLWSIRERYLHTETELEETARTVAAITGVRTVVVGHSHVRSQHTWDSGVEYLNPGGWPSSDDVPGAFLLRRQMDGGLRLVHGGELVLKSSGKSALSQVGERTVIPVPT